MRAFIMGLPFSTHTQLFLQVHDAACNYVCPRHRSAKVSSRRKCTCVSNSWRTSDRSKCIRAWPRSWWLGSSDIEQLTDTRQELWPGRGQRMKPQLRRSSGHGARRSGHGASRGVGANSTSIHSHSRILVAFADLLYTDVVTPFGMFAECLHLQVYPFHVQMWSHPSVDCVSTAKSSPKQFIF